MNNSIYIRDEQGRYKKGSLPWNTGVKGYKSSAIHADVSGKKNPFFGKKHSEETKEKMRLAKLGKSGNNRKPMPDHVKEILRQSHLGKPSPKRGIPSKIRGEKCHLWKGGLTELSKKIRESFRYREWRRQVFERDNYTCQHCGKHGGYLEADHIKAFGVIINEYEIKTFDQAIECQELWKLDNGRTLCRPCHLVLPTTHKRFRNELGQYHRGGLNV